MKKLIGVAGALGVCLLFASPALAAEVHQVGDSKLQLTVPEGWKSEVDGETLTVAHGETATTLVFIPVPLAALSEALDEAQKQIQSSLTELKLSEPSRGEANGMPALVSEGVGRIEGAAVDVALMVVWPTEGWAVVVMGLAESGEASQKAEAGVSALLKSMHRAPGAKAAPAPWAAEVVMKAPELGVKNEVKADLPAPAPPAAPAPYVPPPAAPAPSPPKP